MQFSWPAFGFAVANFLILVGLLYTFLHKPLLRVLQQRSENVTAARKEAEAQARAAEQARAEYEGKLAGTVAEREKTLTEARQQADQARNELIEKAKAEADREIANRKQAYEREQRDAVKQLQSDIVDVAVTAARGILEQAADAELDGKLHAKLLAELDALAGSDERRKELGPIDPQLPVRVRSARALPEPQRAELGDRIKGVARAEATVQFETDQSLVAGTRVEFGALAVDASLADVLVAVRDRVAELAGSDPQPAEAKT